VKLTCQVRPKAQEVAVIVCPHNGWPFWLNMLHLPISPLTIATEVRKQIPDKFDRGSYYSRWTQIQTHRASP